MIKKSFLLGAIVSIITTNAIANQVITSQTYVDNQDALKVNIAQGVGTNNANVGKTLVVNSQGNLELGTVSADNFVEDSITDGVTNKAPSENAVHDALAEKQDAIPAASSDILDEDRGISKTLVATTDSAGTISQIGFTQSGELGSSSLEYYHLDADEYSWMDSMVPSYATLYLGDQSLEKYVNDSMQNEIPQSGQIVYRWNHDDGTKNIVNLRPDASTWLENYVKGTGLVTKTNARGIVGERKIIETADVVNYGTGTATEQQIQEISIPTMGAVMAAISNNTPTLPTGTANTVVMYNNSGAIGGSRAIYDGSTTYNATNDATKLVTANGVSKMKECTRWIDNAAHTDENCLLWRLP